MGAMRVGLCLLMAGLWGTAQAQTTGPARAGSRPVGSAPATRPVGPVPYQPGVMIDWSKKQVLLAGETVLREGELELFACSPNTKEHETIVRVGCRPVHVFQALGLIGLEPGKPPLYDNRTKTVVPATGQRLDIQVRWTADGRTQTVPIWQWLWNKPDNRPAGPVEWVFSGSMVTQEGYLLADLDGTVITVVDFESALISVPVHHTSSNVDLWVQAYTEKIPPTGTAVTVIIQAGKPQLSFRLDDFGQLYVDGQPSTLREAIETARQVSQGLGSDEAAEHGQPAGKRVQPPNDNDLRGQPPFPEVRNQRSEVRTSTTTATKTRLKPELQARWHPKSPRSDGQLAVVEYTAEASGMQAEQLALALRQAGLSGVRIQRVRTDGEALASAGSPSGSATQQGPAGTHGTSSVGVHGSTTQQGPALASFQEQGMAVLQTVSDLGRQLPSAVDALTRSLQAKYSRLNERATAAGRAAAGAARAFEVMQGASGQQGPAVGER